MMKTIIISIAITLLAFSMKMKAQIGINTNTPASTLDITAKNATGTTTNVDGLLIPRVDRQRAQSMTGIPISTLVYINNIATGTAAGIAVNITSTGYYYFNGSVWSKLNVGASASSNSVNSTTGANFNVNDLSSTIVSGTAQSITVPTGGKALFINFMLGIDYTSAPAGGGFAFYEARLYIDGAPTDCYMRVQEILEGGNAQYTLNTVKSLTAGNHTLDIRMTRTTNNGTTSGANMNCKPNSMSFNVTYIN
ncbi:hypothetical protein ODZ84_01480 [Chryseobacterium fluminis]|uniref:hypothetical protein n=1 Tax=Chryseobacterium fluminis TaxID=2983606 RepID=UPI00224D8B25|nr:hypothetical protein [Chryseobacterium sp. MMS21-Ot14]UZT98269.1 hypothetical protein ODZ84_01480 [Chryseobacterium sp. MMS21-Ot14]